MSLLEESDSLAPLAQTPVVPATLTEGNLLDAIPRSNWKSPSPVVIQGPVALLIKRREQPAL